MWPTRIAASIVLALVSAPAPGGEIGCEVAAPSQRLVPPEPDQSFGLAFAKAVGIADGRIVAGSINFNLGCDGVNLCGSTWVLQRNEAGFWTHAGNVFPGDLEHGDQFGAFLDMDGNLLAVSAVAEDGDILNSNIGAVYTFGWDEDRGMYDEGLKFNNPAALSFNQFGHALALCAQEQTLAVGAPNDPGVGALDTGSVYLYDLQNPLEDPVQLKPSDAVENVIDQFGRTVAMDDGTLVAGAPAEGDVPVSNEGQAYVFVDGIEVQKLVASDAGANDQFGTWVDIDGDTIVVGAALRDVDTNDDKGAIYVFERDDVDPNLWNETQIIEPVGVVSNANFGSKVVLQGDVLAGLAPSSQAVLVYHRVAVSNGTTWIHVATLRNDNIITGGQLGGSDHIDLADGSLVVGLPSAFVGPLNAVGAVLVFEAVGTGDCNDNGIPDVCDIEAGILDDADENGLPDDCGGGCDADLAGDDGFVGVSDLLALLAGWGSPAADITGDGNTDVADLLALLAAWGPCPG